MAISAVYVGRQSTIEIDAASSETTPAIVSAVTIGGIFTGSFVRTANTVDSTNNDSGGYTQKEIGNSSATLSFSCRFDPSDAAQLEAEAAANGATKVKKTFRVRPIVGSGESQWLFNGIITSCTINPGVNEEAVNMEISVESSGAVTYSTQ
jgi:hypothetical protein